MAVRTHRTSVQARARNTSHMKITVHSTTLVPTGAQPELGTSRTHSAVIRCLTIMPT